MSGGLPQVPTKALPSDLVRSVTLADPNMPDCPLVGCSQNFEILTGYSRTELLGVNCRFLNKGLPMDPSLREAMKRAISTGDEFLGVITNCKKSGDKFDCLLHILSFFVNGRRYMVGLQADVTSHYINLADPEQVARIRNVASIVFSANLEAWAIDQVAQFNELMAKRGTQSQQAIHGYVEPLQLHSVCDTKNTFVHVDITDDEDLAPPRFMRRTTSESQIPLPAGSEVHQEERQLLQEKQVNSSSMQGDLFRVPRMEVNVSQGSEGHPDKCTECQFHFFSASGCRMGADCRFCHRFHPRKCQKKNRRILKRLQQPSESSVPSAPGMQPGSEEQNIIKGLRYLKEAHVDKARPPRATFMVGQKLRLSPTLDLVNSGSQAVTNCLTFSITPPLPDGITLNSSTGVISGVSKAASQRDLYTVTVSAVATTSNGLQLGSVPLTKCGLSLRFCDGKHGQEEQRSAEASPSIGRPLSPSSPGGRNQEAAIMTAYNRSAGG